MPFIRRYAILFSNIVQRIEPSPTKPQVFSPFTVVDVSDLSRDPNVGDVWNGSVFEPPKPPTQPCLMRFVEVHRKRGRVLCFYDAIEQSSDPVSEDSFIVIVPSTTPVKEGQLYTGTSFIDYPLLYLVLDQLKVDVAENLVYRSKERNKIRVPEGTTVTAPISIRMFSPTGPIVTQYTADYETPVISTDGRERIVTSRIKAGAGEVIYKFDESGIWAISEERINRNLTPGEYLLFEGLFVTATR